MCLAVIILQVSKFEKRRKRKANSRRKKRSRERIGKKYGCGKR